MTPWLVDTCEGAETPIGAQPRSHLFPAGDHDLSD